MKTSEHNVFTVEAENTRDVIDEWLLRQADIIHVKEQEWNSLSLGVPLSSYLVNVNSITRKSVFYS